MRISTNVYGSAVLAFAASMAFTLTAQAQTEFRGGGFVRTLTAACPGGAHAISPVTIRARPAGEPGNSRTDTNVSLFYGVFAVHFSVNDARLLSGRWVPLTVAAHVGSGASYFTSPTAGDAVGVTVRGRPIPNSAMLRGDERHVVAEISNFDFTRGCTVRIGGVVRRQQ